MGSNRRPRLLPPMELEVMQALWRLGETTVRGVYTELNRQRPLAYTTVMTLLDRLARKGAAERRKHQRAYYYRPLLSRRAALDLAVERLADDFFGGSRDRLLAHLGGAEALGESPAAREALDAALL